MPIVLAGATSGSATLQATDAATVTLTLPATSGTLSVSGGSPSFATLTVTGDASISGLTVGKGGGSVSTNTAVGFTAIGSLSGATTGANNSAFGGYAGAKITSGADNTFIGYASAYQNTTGASNTAVGKDSLLNNTTASNNTAVGYQAGYTNTVGLQNTFMGSAAGYTHNNGDGNTFIGYQAGTATTGSYNSTFIGRGAGSAMTGGTKNVILGTYSGNQGGLDIRTASNYIVLSDGDGNPRGYFDGSGNMYVLGIYSNPTSGGGNVRVQNNGLLQRDTSSQKYKNSIENTTHGLNEVLALRPVTYKSNTDGDKIFGGLIAEEVHEAGLTEFVQYAEDGSPDALSYGNMVSLAFKAIQELNAKVTALEAQLGAK